jgi:hypothetical protein
MALLFGSLLITIYLQQSVTVKRPKFDTLFGENIFFS